MTESAVVYTSVPDAVAAARELDEKIRARLGGGPADAIVLFAAPTYDQRALLAELSRRTSPSLLVGASSAGELTHEMRGEGMACALAVRSRALRFSAAVGRGLSVSAGGAAKQLAAGFQGNAPGRSHLHKAALVMTDALAGHADELVDQLTVETSGAYQFFGGGAGDNAQFSRTTVFYKDQVLTDAVVALEILSEKPIGVGVGHGWVPASKPMRVTGADGMRLLSLNGLPAADLIAAHAEQTGQKLDRAAPIPYFLHNIIGIETSTGHRLRVPLAINADGSVLCASEVPAGSVVYFMKTDIDSAAEAARRAAQSAVSGLQGEKPQVGFFFDCVATRLRMGDVFGLELEKVTEALGDTAYLGCNTHGQIARAPGQFGGFHNCTAVVCVLPQ